MNPDITGETSSAAPLSTAWQGRFGNPTTSVPSHTPTHAASVGSDENFSSSDYFAPDVRMGQAPLVGRIGYGAEPAGRPVSMTPGPPPIGTWGPPQGPMRMAMPYPPMGFTAKPEQANEEMLCAEGVPVIDMPGHTSLRPRMLPPPAFLMARPAPMPPTRPMTAGFIPTNRAPADVMTTPPLVAAPTSARVLDDHPSDCDRHLAGSLGVVLGCFGAGRFYVGDVALGCAQAALFAFALLTGDHWGDAPGGRSAPLVCSMLWGAIDGVMLFNKERDVAGRRMR